MDFPVITLDQATLALFELNRVLKEDLPPDRPVALTTLRQSRIVLPASRIAFHTFGKIRSLGILAGDLHLLIEHLQKVLTDAGEKVPKDLDEDEGQLGDWRLKAGPHLSPTPSATPDKPPPVPRPRGALGIWTVATPQAAAAALNRIGCFDSSSKKMAAEWINKLANEQGFYLSPVPAVALSRVEALAYRFPNFGPVIRAIVDDLCLRRVCREYLRLEPMLIVGPPGIGKTMFAEALARAVGFQLTIRSLAEMTAGFLLTGNSRRWLGSGPGLIAELIAHLPAGKMPLLYLDEIDKAREGNYPPTRPLIGLLEPATAQRFVDEFLDLELDVRPLSYLFTANALAPIPDYLLSRLKIIHVASPTREQMPAIVRSVDDNMRQHYRQMSLAFAPLDEEIQQQLSAMPPRRVALLLRAAYAAAARTRPNPKARFRRVTSADLKAARSYLLPGE